MRSGSCANCGNECEGTCTGCCLEGDATRIGITANRVEKILAEKTLAATRAALRAFLAELRAKETETWEEHEEWFRVEEEREDEKRRGR